MYFLIIRPSQLPVGHELDPAPPAVCAGMLQRDRSQVFTPLESVKVFAYICLNCCRWKRLKAPPGGQP